MNFLKAFWILWNLLSSLEVFWILFILLTSSNSFNCNNFFKLPWSLLNSLCIFFNSLEVFWNYLKFLWYLEILLIPPNCLEFVGIPLNSFELARVLQHIWILINSQNFLKFIEFFWTHLKFLWIRVKFFKFF